MPAPVPQSSIGYWYSADQENRLKLLCETMDSVQAQTFARWDDLIIDDGSNDGTAEEVARRAVVDAHVAAISNGPATRLGQTSAATLSWNPRVPAPI